VEKHCSTRLENSFKNYFKNIKIDPDSIAIRTCQRNSQNETQPHNTSPSDNVAYIDWVCSDKSQPSGQESLGGIQTNRKLYDRGTFPPHSDSSEPSLVFLNLKLWIVMGFKCVIFIQPDWRIQSFNNTSEKVNCSTNYNIIAVVPTAKYVSESENKTVQQYLIELEDIRLSESKQIISTYCFLFLFSPWALFNHANVCLSLFYFIS
jgi:hypothetical protein